MQGADIVCSPGYLHIKRLRQPTSSIGLLDQDNLKTKEEPPKSPNNNLTKVPHFWTSMSTKNVYSFCRDLLVFSRQSPAARRVPLCGDATIFHGWNIKRSILDDISHAYFVFSCCYVTKPAVQTQHGHTRQLFFKLLKFCNCICIFIHPNSR